jgi:hypothetical protein
MPVQRGLDAHAPILAARAPGFQPRTALSRLCANVFGGHAASSLVAWTFFGGAWALFGGTWTFFSGGRSSGPALGAFRSALGAFARPLGLLLGPWGFLLGPWGFLLGPWGFLLGPWGFPAGPWSVLARDRVYLTQTRPVVSHSPRSCKPSLMPHPAYPATGLGSRWLPCPDRHTCRLYRHG